MCLNDSCHGLCFHTLMCVLVHSCKWNFSTWLWHTCLRVRRAVMQTMTDLPVHCKKAILFTCMIVKAWYKFRNLPARWKLNLTKSAWIWQRKQKPVMIRPCKQSFAPMWQSRHMTVEGVHDGLFMNKKGFSATVMNGKETSRSISAVKIVVAVGTCMKDQPGATVVGN